VGRGDVLGKKKEGRERVGNSLSFEGEKTSLLLKEGGRRKNSSFKAREGFKGGLLPKTPWGERLLPAEKKKRDDISGGTCTSTEKKSCRSIMEEKRKKEFYSN